MYNALLQTATTAAAGEGSLLMTVVPFALIFIIFYFFLIRPQNKKQKETEKMIAALKKGDKVVTIGGIHGVVASTKEHTIIVKVDDGAKIEQIFDNGVRFWKNHANIGNYSLNNSPA